MGNELDTYQFNEINLSCDKVLSAALRWLLDEILFPLRLSSFRRKILFHPRAPLASETAQFFSLAFLSSQPTISLGYQRSRGLKPGAHAPTTQLPRETVNGRQV